MKRTKISALARIDAIVTLHFIKMRFSTLIIALDANIWIHERLLRSSLGAALLYALKRSETKIALPTVTRKEVLEGLVEIGLESVSKIGAGFLTVQTIIGKKPDINLPDNKQFSTAIEARFTVLAPMLMPLEASLADYEATTDRVIEGRPPNERKEQFRDSLVLELLIPYAQKFPVHFVTRDGDFYEGGKPDKGIAMELQKELKEKKANLRFHAGIEQLLTSFGPAVFEVDTYAITNALKSAIANELVKHANTGKYHLGEFQSSKIEAFVTERHDILAISFELTFQVTDVRSTEESILSEATLIAKGSASYNMDTQLATEIQLEDIKVYGPNQELLIRNSAAFITGVGGIGIQQIPYSVRRKLGELI